MSDVSKINKADVDLALEYYSLSKNQIDEAKKLFQRSSFSWLKSCKIIKNIESL